MKKTSQVLLASLYSSTASERQQVSLTTLRVLLRDLSDAGFRSLVYTLERGAVVYKQTVGSDIFISITDKGVRALEAQFPALSDRYEGWDGTWQAIVFLEAPKGDHQFRYLRSVLLQEGAVNMSRGVYLWPGELSDKLWREMTSQYEHSVAVFSIGEWKLGNERPIVDEEIGLRDISSSYSGISREVNELLAIFLQKSILNDQQKKHSYDILIRFLEVLHSDSGFITRYVPGLDTPRVLLTKLQQLILL